MRNGLKVVLCFGRVHKVFFPFFNKISCKLYFQESLTKGSDTFCLAITCCCSILNILQEHPKKVWQTIALPQYHWPLLPISIIKYEKKYSKIFCKPQFGESCTMGSIFWDTRGTVWPQILQYPLSPELQPALELLWTFTISIFNLTNAAPL